MAILLTRTVQPQCSNMLRVGSSCNLIQLPACAEGTLPLPDMPQQTVCAGLVRVLLLRL